MEKTGRRVIGILALCGTGFFAILLLNLAYMLFIAPELVEIHFGLYLNAHLDALYLVLATIFFTALGVAFSISLIRAPALKILCPKCGEKASPGQEFCAKCGAKLG